MNHPQSQPRYGNPAPPGRRWCWAAFFAGWTVLATVAIWWLVTHPVEPNLVIRPGTADKPWNTRLREGIELFRIQFDWVWRWGLLAPYVMWLGSRLPLERRRLVWHGLLLLGAGAGFVLASQALGKHLGSRHSMVVIVSTQAVARTLPASTMSNAINTAIYAGPSRGGGQVRLGTNRVYGTNIVLRHFATNRPLPLPACLPPGPAQFLFTNIIVAELSGGTGASHLLASNWFPPLDEGLRGSGGGGFSAGGFGPLPVAMDGVAYLALLGVAQTVHYRRRYREREQQALLLSSRLNEARLRALQAQLQPHFLFNALNGIATLVRRDPPAAHEMLTSLSELLRLALSRSERQEIPLREEMEFLDRYLEIQRMRFGDRLEVVEELAPDTMDCRLPALLLQPLVENAIRHGIEPSPRPGLVRLTAARDRDWLVLTVADNGVGMAAAPDSPSGAADGIEPARASSSTPGVGMGLASVRERLQALYGERHAFELGPGPTGGVSVRICLPFQVAAKPMSKPGKATV